MRRVLTIAVVAGLSVGYNLTWGVLVVGAGANSGALECGALTADLNADGVVDFADFFILADQFGLSCSRTSGTEKTALLSNGVTMSFVWIAPGTFTMGSPSSEPRRYDSEGPQHRVTISRGFYLGKYEVTQEQWESVIGTRPWLGEEYVEVAPNNPAVYVSWGDTQILIHRLNEAAGDSLYQLPSEAEWEYACRAGTTTSWSFGNDWLQLWDYAWYIENTYDRGQNHAVQVGTRLPNPWGLFDMHGNVSEWCQDWYEDYSANNQTDPSGPSKGSYRVYRGGGYFSVYPSTRSAYRGFSVPDNRSYTIGVRLVRTK